MTGVQDMKKGEGKSVREEFFMKGKFRGPVSCLCFHIKLPWHAKQTLIN